MRPDAAEQAETRLDEQRRLHQSFLVEIVQIVEVAGIIAFEFIARAGCVECIQRKTNVLEAVAEDEVMAALQHRRLPLMLELLEALEHGEQAEVHRSHVEARHLRLPYRRRPYQIGRASCRERVCQYV